MRPVLFLAVALLLPSLVATAAAAEFFDPVVSTAFVWDGLFASGRLTAMGGGDLAGRDPAALLINPAPLGGGDGAGLSYGHADYFGDDLDFNTTAGFAEWRHWRLNVAAQDFLVGPIAIGTAYEPEGSGDTFEESDRVTVVGLSYDLGRGLLGSRVVGWSVGAAWRRCSADRESGESAADALDLGTTVSWLRRYDGIWTRLSGAVSWQNATDAEITTYNFRLGMPRPLRTGLTLEAGFERAGSPGDLVKVALAYTRATQLGDSHLKDTDHVGVEAVAVGVLALRYGHSTKITGGMSSWGVGLVLEDRLPIPFALEADFGKVSADDGFFAEDMTIWGLRARYDFGTGPSTRKGEDR